MQITLRVLDYQQIHFEDVGQIYLRWNKRNFHALNNANRLIDFAMQNGHLQLNSSFTHIDSSFVISLPCQKTVQIQFYFLNRNISQKLSYMGFCQINLNCLNFHQIAQERQKVTFSTQLEESQKANKKIEWMIEVVQENKEVKQNQKSVANPQDQKDKRNLVRAFSDQLQKYSPDKCQRQANIDQQPLMTQSITQSRWLLLPSCVIPEQVELQNLNESIQRQEVSLFGKRNRRKEENFSTSGSGKLFSERRNNNELLYERLRQLKYKHLLQWDEVVVSELMERAQRSRH